jgi:hypothetical protein
MQSCGQGGGQNLRRRTGRPSRGVPPAALPPPERRCPEPGRTKTGAAERYRPRPGYRPRSPLLPARKPSLPTRPPKAKPPPRSRSSVAPSHSPPAQGDHPTSILAGCGLWGQEAPQVVDNFGASVDWRGGPVSTLADRPAGGELDRASPATHRGRSGEAVGGLRTWGASCSSARVTSGGEPGATGCRALGRTTASAVAGHSGEPGPGGSRVLGCTAPSAAAVQWRAVAQRVSGPGVAPCLLQRRPGPSRCLALPAGRPGAAASRAQVVPGLCLQRRRDPAGAWTWALPSVVARCGGEPGLRWCRDLGHACSAARCGGEPGLRWSWAMLQRRPGAAGPRGCPGPLCRASSAARPGAVASLRWQVLLGPELHGVRWRGHYSGGGLGLGLPGVRWRRLRVGAGWLPGCPGLPWTRRHGLSGPAAERIRIVGDALAGRRHDSSRRPERRGGTRHVSARAASAISDRPGRARRIPQAPTQDPSTCPVRSRGCRTLRGQRRQRVRLRRAASPGSGPARDR